MASTGLGLRTTLKDGATRLNWTHSQDLLQIMFLWEPLMYDLYCCFWNDNLCLRPIIHVEFTFGSRNQRLNKYPLIY